MAVNIAQLLFADSLLIEDPLELELPLHAPLQDLT